MKADIQAVLFDLDGTLLNTVPDLVFALNQLRSESNLPPLETARASPAARLGSKAMLKLALGIDESDSNYASWREKFMTTYQAHIADATHFFPEMETVLTYLDQQQMPWGIVTNKLTIHTEEVLKALDYFHRPKCIVCGDTLTTYKPDPEPILHACRLLGVTPQNCLYIGDAPTDVLASKAAGTYSLVALYGYIDEDEDPLSWGADGYIQHPIEILEWLKNSK